MRSINSVFSPIGARVIAREDREENDYYATDPNALKLVLADLELDHNVWECACGAGHLSKVLEDNGYNVKSTDLYDRGYGISGVNFLETEETFNGDILTNPPYSLALDFVKKGLDVIEDGHKVVMFLKIQFLEGKKRREFFKENPPKYVIVSSSRSKCAKGGNEELFNGPSAVCYAWFVWVKGFKGDPKIRWFN